MKIGYYYCVIAVYILLLFWDYAVIHSILYGNGFAKIGLALSLIPTVILTIFLIRNYPSSNKLIKLKKVSMIIPPHPVLL